MMSLNSCNLTEISVTGQQVDMQLAIHECIAVAYSGVTKRSIKKMHSLF